MESYHSPLFDYQIYGIRGRYYPGLPSVKFFRPFCNNGTDAPRHPTEQLVFNLTVKQCLDANATFGCKCSYEQPLCPFLLRLLQGCSQLAYPSVNASLAFSLPLVRYLTDTPVLLSLRTWAVWGRDLKVGIGLLILYMAIMIPNAVNMAFFLKSVTCESRASLKIIWHGF